MISPVVKTTLNNSNQYRDTMIAQNTSIWYKSDLFGGLQESLMARTDENMNKIDELI